MKLTKEEIARIIDYEIVVDCYTDEETMKALQVWGSRNSY
jgi:hypothetical protein